MPTKSARKGASSRGSGSDRRLPLSFDDDRLPPPRAGDELAPDEYRNEFPPSRGRHAGVSVPDEISDDDLSPETLIDEDGDPPADKVLRHVDASEIGARGGPDEAQETEGEAASDRLIRKRRGD